MTVTVRRSDGGRWQSWHEGGVSCRLADGRLVSVVHGPHPVDLDDLVRWLDRGCPDPPPVRQGFAIAVSDSAKGSLVFATSPRLEVSGYFTASTDGVLASTHLRHLCAHLPQLPAMEPSRLLSVRREITPFSQVDRVPTGHVLVWAQGALTLREWFTPRQHDRPMDIRPREAVPLMRAAIVTAVEASLPAEGTPASFLSGGLDSAMVAAIAAGMLHADGRHLAAASHAPLPGPNLERNGWDASDEQYVRLLGNAVPGLTIQILRNEERLCPLDVFDDYFEASYLPVLNPANLVWVSQIARWAESLGTGLMLGGGSGNATFSKGQTQALRELVEARQWARLLWWTHHAAQAQGLRRAVRSASGAVKYNTRGAGNVKDGARRFRASLAMRRRALDVATEELLNAATGGHVSPALRSYQLMRFDPAGRLGIQGSFGRVWFSDPFSDPEVVRLALSLPADAWLFGGIDRGLARAAASGVLPDGVRLRQTRGAQAADLSQWLAPNVTRYHDSLDRLEASPTATSFVDVAELRRSMTMQTFTDPRAAAEWEIGPGRMLGVGLYAAWWDEKRTAARVASRDVV